MRVSLIILNESRKGGCRRAGDFQTFTRGIQPLNAARRTGCLRKHVKAVSEREQRVLPANARNIRTFHSQLQRMKKPGDYKLKKLTIPHLSSCVRIGPSAYATKNPTEYMTAEHHSMTLLIPLTSSHDGFSGSHA
jgi:hypothetical protein